MAFIVYRGTWTKYSPEGLARLFIIPYGNICLYLARSYNTNNNNNNSQLLYYDNTANKYSKGGLSLLHPKEKKILLAYY